MSENLKTELLSQGVDYATTLERFMGKEELYKRFLIKFLADDNCKHWMWKYRGSI